jgi:RimJ/RimL family protein N-acetyltransferase
MATPVSLREPILTERLVLRPYTAADLDDYAAMQGNEEVVRYMLWPLRDRKQSAKHLARRRRQTRLSHAGDFLGLAIELPGEPSLNPKSRSGRVIGDASLLLRSVGHRQAEIGWVLHPDFGGKGYATEASRVMLDLAIGRLGAHRVVAQLDARNTGSAAMAERLGMRREGLFREDLWFKGAWGDSLYYAILDEEWTASPLSSS